MRELYHCFYREPQGLEILASCFREVNGVSDNYLFAATHLTKSLVFAFSYHDKEVVLNDGIENSDQEIVLLVGGQATLDKPRRTRVFAFPGDGFEEIPGARQAVSKQPMPFSRARLVMDTTDINDLMRAGLQIFVLPERMERYTDREGGGRKEVVEIYAAGATHGEAMKALMDGYGARWVNLERGINPSEHLNTCRPRAFAHAPTTGFMLK